MGIATIMIIICHTLSYGEGVLMPDKISKIVICGNFGVDIFLFLSGIGCYYSLNKGINLTKWYKKRIIRIFLPYTFIQIPFWIYRILEGHFNLKEELLCFSTISFWTKHIGAWYVALLIPLYFLTPYIYKLVSEKCKYAFLNALILIFLLLILCNLEINKTNETTYNILYNLQWAFCRVPSFIIGMYIAPFVKNNTTINVFKVIGFIIILLGIHVGVHRFIDKDIVLYWCLALPLVLGFTFFLSWLPQNGILLNSISWMGVVSLESYLANIYLKDTIYQYIYIINAYPQKPNILYGHYLEYTCVIILGLILSYIIHKIVNKYEKVLFIK